MTFTKEQLVTKWSRLEGLNADEIKDVSKNDKKLVEQLVKLYSITESAAEGQISDLRSTLPKGEEPAKREEEEAERKPRVVEKYPSAHPQAKHATRR